MMRTTTTCCRSGSQQITTDVAENITTTTLICEGIMEREELKKINKKEISRNK